MKTEENGQRIEPAKTADVDLEGRRRERRGKPWGVMVGLGFLVVAVGFAGYARFGASDRITVGPMEQESDRDDDAALAATTLPPESTTTTAVAVTKTTVQAFETTTSIRSTTLVTGAPLVGQLRSGSVELTGTVPSLEVGESFIALFEAFVGAGNVNEVFEVSQDAPIPTSFQLDVTDTVLFGAGGETVSPQFFPLLDEVVLFMEADPNVTLIVEGHTDSDGDTVDNLALSQRRADAVRAYLEDSGINAFRLEARGRGDTEAVADNSTEEGRRQNRRIEFLLVGFQAPAE